MSTRTRDAAAPNDWELLFDTLETPAGPARRSSSGDLDDRRTRGAGSAPRSQRQACQQTARERGGIDELALDWSTRGALLDNRVVTLAAVERHLANGTLLGLNRIGPKRLRAIAGAVRAHHEAAATAGPAAAG